MLDCLILGDSIAVGVQHAKPQCSVVAKVGINSQHFVDTYKNNFSAKTAIISLGSNDSTVKKTYNELYALRQRVDASRVYWISPNPNRFPKQAEDVKLIAISFGDTVISTQKYSPDGVHPTTAGYKELVNKVE